MKNPQEVLEGLEQDRAELVRLSSEYDTARRALGKIEYDYEKEMAKALVNFEVNHRERFGDKRLPGEDLRKAYAHGVMSDIWQQYLATRAQVDALERLIKIRQSHLSSLQSELNYMTEDLRRS